MQHNGSNKTFRTVKEKRIICTKSFSALCTFDEERRSTKLAFGRRKKNACLSAADRGVGEVRTVSFSTKKG